MNVAGRNVGFEMIDGKRYNEGPTFGAIPLGSGPRQHGGAATRFHKVEVIDVTAGRRPGPVNSLEPVDRHLDRPVGLRPVVPGPQPQPGSRGRRVTLARSQLPALRSGGDLA